MGKRAIGQWAKDKKSCPRHFYCPHCPIARTPKQGCIMYGFVYAVAPMSVIYPPQAFSTIDGENTSGEGNIPPYKGASSIDLLCSCTIVCSLKLFYQRGTEILSRSTESVISSFRLAYRESLHKLLEDSDTLQRSSHTIVMCMQTIAIFHPRSTSDL